MTEQATVSKEEWLEARRAFLEKEKEFTRLRDELSEQRRQLPRVKIEKNYRFIGNEGELGLADLFGNNSQLAVYHFMFGPEWEEGCPSCSYWADNYNGMDIHLAHRDIKLIAISRGPLEKLNAYKERMGWNFDWYSSLNNDFNFDFNVSFTEEQQASGKPIYNFDTMPFHIEEAPGFSVFQKDEQGDIYHTYSTFARGLDIFNMAYHIMDMTPKGRDEDDLPFTMGWVRRHDQYED
ncbi:MAG: DUF899 domain-containing protein [Pseudomonadales bacterium]|nr:DUF899 domain-containing protein [Pseudomonadales bacterium]